MNTGQIEIGPAQWPRDLEPARFLLRQYFESLSADPLVPASIREKDRAPELDTVAALYDPVASPLLVAREAHQLRGCVAVRMLPGRAGAAEVKRLYVEPGSRGFSLGRWLAFAAINWARRQGASELLLDTLPAAMAPAVGLYRSLGFQPTERYNNNDGAEFAFFRLSLDLPRSQT